MGSKQIGQVVHVTYEQDESGAWIAEVREQPSCHTHGRSIGQARARIREAMQLFDELDGAEVVDEIKLPAVVKRALKVAKAAREKAEAEAQRAASVTAQAVRALAESGVSVRDAADMLGVSHQRVHQILHSR